jgi:hypothetical protein
MNEIESISMLNGINMSNPSVTLAYQEIVRRVSDIITQVPSKDMRRIIILPETNLYSHSLLSPLIMLKLSLDKQVISFAIDLELKDYLGREQYHSLFRVIYECTTLYPECLDQMEYWHTDFEEALDNPNAIELLIETNEGR